MIQEGSAQLARTLGQFGIHMLCFTTFFAQPLNNYEKRMITMHALNLPGNNWIYLLGIFYVSFFIFCEGDTRM